MTFQSLKENNHPQIWIQEMKIVDYLMIGATIRIGREILCLPYAGFLSFRFQCVGGCIYGLQAGRIRARSHKDSTLHVYN